MESQSQTIPLSGASTKPSRKNVKSAYSFHKNKNDEAESDKNLRQKQ